MPVKNPTNIAVLVSGGGTNLQALIDAERNQQIVHGHIALVVSSNEGAFALTRAQEAGIPTAIVNRRQYQSQDAWDAACLALLEEANIELVVLAGFMTVISETFISRFPQRIINVHPSLIPSFCGPGFYGLCVHEAALAKGVKVSGATVHFVNEIADGGPIIAQRAVDVLPDDTPETLQRRIMEQAEWILLPQVTEELSRQLFEQRKGNAL